MLSFQRDPIPTSLTRLPTALQKKAVGMFQEILHYMGLKGAPVTHERALAQTVVRILKLVLGKPEMREELYAQLHKQTRNNHDKDACLRAWEVMHLCASVAPPGEQLGKPITDYVHEVANDAAVDAEVMSQALATWHALNKAMKVGARKRVPTVDELLALKTGRALMKVKTKVFFEDDTFEEVEYDASTTTAEIFEVCVVEEWGKDGGREWSRIDKWVEESDRGHEESVARSGAAPRVEAEPAGWSFGETRERQVELRLMFRKKIFRDNEKAITDPVFILLSYLQVMHDYGEGNYPMPPDDVAQLTAFQLIADFDVLPEPEATLTAKQSPGDRGGGWPSRRKTHLHVCGPPRGGFSVWAAMLDCTRKQTNATQDSKNWQAEVQKRIPVQLQSLREKPQWAMDVLTRYKELPKLTPEGAKQQSLTIIRALPYGLSSFYHVRRIQDPTGLLPERVLIGINKCGVHYFRPVPREYLHSAELRDIKQYGSNPAAVFLKVRVVSSLHVVQFETSQGEEICHAIETHTNDALARRSARESALQHNAPTLGSGPAGGGAAGDGGSGGGGGGGVLGEGHGQGPHPITDDEHRTEELSESLARAVMHIEQLNQEVAARAASEAQLQVELQAAKEALRQQEMATEEAVEKRDRLAEKLRRVERDLHVAIDNLALVDAGLREWGLHTGGAVASGTGVGVVCVDDGARGEEAEEGMRGQRRGAREQRRAAAVTRAARDAAIRTASVVGGGAGEVERVRLGEEGLLVKARKRAAERSHRREKLAGRVP
ncbi:unnamed protein product [Closterium sp. Naga37s-1]|nr:unnamed protein product [Closterium sp. Naga37s-1]